MSEKQAPTEYLMSIAGQKRAASDGGTIEVRNVYDNSVIGTIPAATKQDAQDALDAARIGANKWAGMPSFRRHQILKDGAKLIRSRRDELVPLLSAEHGKTLADAGAEFDTAVRIIDGFADESLRLFGETIPLDIQQGFERDLMLTLREPLGVMVGIVPFNFPVELYAHKVGAALAAGNAIVVKPPEDDPIVSLIITDILHEAGVPGETLQIVTGYGHIVGDYLSRSPQIDAITFTGSTRVGKMIAAHAGENIVRAFLELSGNDAFIVCSDADVDIAVEQAIAGRTYTNGQVCAATKRILVERPLYSEFLEKLTARVSALRVGDQLAEGVDIGPLINEKAAERIQAQVEEAVSQGATLVTGGDRAGALYTPAVLEISREVGIATNEEIFGPVFSVLPVDSLDEAIEITNASEYGLNAGVFTTDLLKAIDAGRRIQAGTVSVNGGNAYRPDVAAFGGYKKSGIGREGTRYTLEEFTQLKNLVLRDVIQF